MDEVTWEQFSTRGHPRPRRECYYGDPGTTYRYSGTTFEPREWTSPLHALLDRVRDVEPRIASALLFRYDDGSDSVSWHTDVEVAHGEDPVIIAAVLGAARDVQLRPRGATRIAVSIRPGHGDAFSMRGPAVSEFEHCVPKRRSPVGPRIVISFRTHR
jgi:alkylated DNA repair dioxygenase AlkB